MFDSDQPTNFDPVERYAIVCIHGLQHPMAISSNLGEASSTVRSG